MEPLFRGLQEDLSSRNGSRGDKNYNLRSLCFNVKDRKGQSEHQRKIGKPDGRRMIFPDPRYYAGTVSEGTRISRVLCGERSGAVYICSREKTQTHHASARLGLHWTFSLRLVKLFRRNNLTTRHVKGWSPKALIHPHPLRVPSRRYLS